MIKPFALSCLINHSMETASLLEISSEIDIICERSEDRTKEFQKLFTHIGITNEHKIPIEEHVIILSNYDIKEFLYALGNLKNSNILYQLVTGNVMIEDVYKG